MITPQMHSDTQIDGEVHMSRDLDDYTLCVRVKPKFIQDTADAPACEPIALIYEGTVHFD